MSRTPVDRTDAPLSAYLLKILTILVKRSNGEIRIDATDMLEESAGEGISKRYDRDKKQLVLTFLEAGSEIYFNKGDDSWQSPMDLSNLRSPKSQLGPSQRSSIAQPLLRSDLTENLELSHESQPVSRTSSTLDDLRISEMEDFYRKEAAARALANFPSTPVTEPSRQPRVSQRRVPQSFFRT